MHIHKLPKALNFVIRRYFRDFHLHQLEWRLNASERAAYENLKTAYERKIADFFADVSDLQLVQSVRIAHRAMQLPEHKLPVFYVPQPKPELSTK